MQSIHIVEEFLPFAWEKAVVACWETGERFPTEYDKPGDPDSRDVACLIHVRQPHADPRIHRAFPGGLDDLEKYREEVLYGVHDHWIDPSVGKWEYTYHERLRAYDVPGVGVIDQIAGVIEKLKEAGHTRRAQAVTWQAWQDVGIHDPACLQRLWFRVSNDGKLQLNVHMRSNDAFKAAFMNMYAFTELQKYVADAVGVDTGDYIHMVDSFHIYGSYFTEFEGFLQSAASRTDEHKVFDSAFSRDFFIDGCDALLAEDDMPAEKKALVQARRDELAGM